MAGSEMKKIKSLTQDTRVDDAEPLMNRRDLLRASTGLALNSLPLLAGGSPPSGLVSDVTHRIWHI
jgi:hypothetical protein